MIPIMKMMPVDMRLTFNEMNAGERSKFICYSFSSDSLLIEGEAVLFKYGGCLIRGQEVQEVARGYREL